MSNVIPFPTKPAQPRDLYDAFVEELTSHPKDTLTVYVLVECFGDGSRKLLLVHDDGEIVSDIVDHVQKLQPQREFIIQPMDIGVDVVDR